MDKDQLVFLVTQKDIRDEEPDADGLYTMGCVARIRQFLKVNDKSIKVLAEGLYRAKLINFVNTGRVNFAEIERVDEKYTSHSITYREALIRKVKDEFEHYSMVLPGGISNDILLQAAANDEIAGLTDFIASNMPAPYDDRQFILEQLNPYTRAKMLLKLLSKEISLQKIDNKISEAVKMQIDDNQREYYLKEQIKAINEELYGEVAEESDEYFERIHKLNAPQDVKDKLFAEAIKLHQPDIVAFDASEPREDHFDEEQRKYFDNKDKGAGAKTFFQTLVKSNLQDSYATLNKEQYKKGEPLAISHIINGKERKRYDFIYTNRKFEIVKSEYLYQEAIDASADHAMVVTDFIGDMQYRMRDPNIDFDALPFEGNTSLEELLSYCLYYKGEDDYPESSGDDNKSHLWNYELVWVKSCQQNRHYIAQVVQDYIFAGLELFNINDGTPLSLKAILFNRYQHWCGGNGWLNDINGFKDFYLKDYKTKI
jgi:Lon protease-like protein